MKTFLIFSIIIISGFSCIKETPDDDPEYHLKGTLYNDCNKVPRANQYMEIYNQGGGVFGPSGSVFSSCTTDAQGRFDFTMKGKKGVTGFTINFGSGPRIFDVPIHDNTENAVLYYGQATASVKGIININNGQSYTNQDTLRFSTLQSGVSGKIAGPFPPSVVVRGKITSPLYSFAGNPVQSTSANFGATIRHLNNSENVVQIVKSIGVPLSNYCNISDTVNVTIDIP